MQLDGWGIAGHNFIQALKDKCDLTVRNIYLSKNTDRRLVEDPFYNLRRAQSSYDAVIQQVLPNMVTYNARCGINCVLPCLETWHQNDMWVSRLKMMDKVLVFTDFEKDNMEWPIKDVVSVGGALDLEAINEKHEPFNDFKHTYNFYFIGENVGRKRLETLIKCYFQEFSYKDSVNLVVKSDNRQNFEDLLKRVKSGLRKYFHNGMYPKITHVDGFISQADIYRLHKSCDCFVMPSYGESFCIPMAEALCFRNDVIVNKNCGAGSLVDENNAWLINSTPKNVYCTDPPIISLYTCREKWFDINEEEMMAAMRAAYGGATRKTGRDKIISQFSNETVGNNIIRCLQS